MDLQQSLPASWGAWEPLACFSTGNNTASGIISATSDTRTVANIICTGTAILPVGAGPSTGSVLKVFRTNLNPHPAVTVPTNGSAVTCITMSHTPSDSSSTLNIISFISVWKWAVQMA